MSGQGLEPVKRFVVKGIAGGIGLASESVHAHRERKRQEKAALERSQSNPDLTAAASSSTGEHQNEKSINNSQDALPLQIDDEEYWILDDAQEDILPPPYTEKDKQAEQTQEEVTQGVSELTINEKSKEDAKKTAAAFIRRHPAPPHPTEKIALPVILPQRRPKNRARGFIRAYPPVLEAADINQDTWIDFLDTFYESSQASPWLNAINLAGIGTIFLPQPASILVGLAITISVKVAMDVQNRQRTNSFLDKANEEFFRPRGLFCLIMTYDPNSSEVHSTVNLATTISSTLNPHGIEHVSHMLRNSAGKTYGELEFPEAAPLVFPELDKLATQTGAEAEQKKNKLKAAGDFVDNYWDNRAQARYAYKHPDSLLAQGPKPEFHSRYADPNHPASSGSFVSLVTGGAINPPPMTRGFGGLGGLGGLGRGRGFGGGRGFGRSLGGFGGFGGLGGLGSGYEARREALEARRFGGGFGGRYLDDPYMGRGYGSASAYDPRQEALEARMAGGGRLGGGLLGRGYAVDPYTGRGSGNGYYDDGYVAERDGYPTDRSGPTTGRGDAFAARGQVGLGSIIGFGGPVPIIKKVFQKDVLYLMVVNMPSDEELAAAMAELERLKKR